MSFTEIKAEELKDNPFDLIGKQWMLITAGNEEKCNISVIPVIPKNLWTEKIILHWHSLEKSIEKR
mgnify:CR=1 FL=1